jgi:ethanolamine transporter EutH
MASCQGNFDSTFPWSVDWDQVSKLAVVPDNTCCGCSYYLLDWRQILFRMIFLLLLWMLLVVVVFVLLLLLLLWYFTAALSVGFLAVTNVIFAVLSVGLAVPFVEPCFPLYRVI